MTNVINAQILSTFPDSTFGEAGIVKTDMSFGNDLGNALSIQSDGKIIVGGWAENENNFNFYNFALARYNSNGTLDNSFGTNGKVISNLESITSGINAIALQSNGKILATGFLSDSLKNYLALVRYNMDGSFDSTFGNGGIVKTLIIDTAIMGGAYNCANTIALQNDGKIVVAGYSFYSPLYNLYKYYSTMARYNINGSLDTSFGNGGKVKIQIGNKNSETYAIKIQKDGKIVSAGISNIDSISEFAISRYNTNGSLDSTFGTNGTITQQIGTQGSGAYALDIQADNKIVVAGTASPDNYNWGFAIARYDSTGTLDNSFGNGGIVITQEYALNNAKAMAVIIQNNGNIIAGGSVDNYYWSLRKFNYNGVFESGLTTIMGNTDQIHALSFQSDGKIIAVGETGYNCTNFDFATVRYIVDSLLLSNEVVLTKKEIYLYPNPTSNIISIEIPQNIKGCTLTISDLNGQVLIKQQIKDSRSQIDISALTSGIYFARLITDKKVEVIKIIKE